jgi:hypothetical protein
MRSTWPFVAGIIIAGLVTVFTLPILVVTGFGMMALGRMGHEDGVLQGGSSFVLRDDHGRYTSRLTNTTYNILTVPMVGEPRPRRLLVRQRTVVGEDGEGLARLDAWPMGSPAELRKEPLYTIRALAASAVIGDDSLFWTERAGRRTAYSLADGNRLFDADLPLVQFTFEPEARRLAALSVADDEFSARGGVAVITYAAPGRILRRVVLVATDPMRGNMMRATLSSTRLVSFTDDALGGRVIELPLAAGSVRVPVGLNDLDLARAVLPPGLKLVPLRQWGS